MLRSVPPQPPGVVITKTDEVQARRAVIAQEFLRIILGGGQPKAKYLELSNGRHGVRIEDTPGCEPFNKQHAVSEIKEKILGREVKGLGQLLVACLFLNDTDVPLTSLKIVSNRVIKIGTECIWRGDAPCKDTIEAVDLTVLPFLANHVAKNWLDRVINGHMPTWPILACTELKENPHFMTEVNEGILRCLLLSDDFIKGEVRKYTNSPFETQRIVLELMLRKRDLRKAALNKPTFVEYIQTVAAQQTLLTQQRIIIVPPIEDKREALFLDLRSDAFHLSHATTLPPLRKSASALQLKPTLVFKQVSDNTLPELKLRNNNRTTHS